MVIFDETVVSGTVLLLTPILKSTTLSPSENNREPGRAQRLKRFVQPLTEFKRHGLAILNFRLALIGGAPIA
jgi:hypothetical protein